MKLAPKLILVNSAVLLGVTGVVVWVQGQQTDQAMLGLIDEQLRGRMRMLEGPGPGGPGRGPGRPPGMARRQEWVRVLGRDGTVRFPNEARDALGPFSDRPEFREVVVDGVRLRVLSAPIRGGEEIGQVGESMAPVLLRRQAQAASLLVLIPLAVGLSLGAAWFLARGMTRPILRLSNYAEKVSATPDAKERVEPEGDDEIADLTRSVNAMTDNLQAALERQRRFTSDAAHELRTPLAGISLATENALHPEATSAEREEALHSIHRLGGNMTRLTETLLALARLDRADSPLPVGPMALHALVEEALQSAGLAGDHRIQNEATGEATGNPAATVQILRNFLDNAKSVTPEDGHIRIWTSEGRLMVSDTGPGIAPEHLPHLFDRFYRADASRSRGGHGLGLSIAQALALAMGATLRVESKVGVGTTFFIDFSKKSRSS